jgi:hypothetical protein
LNKGWIEDRQRGVRRYDRKQDGLVFRTLLKAIQDLLRKTAALKLMRKLQSVVVGHVNALSKVLNTDRLSLAVSVISE